MQLGIAKTKAKRVGGTAVLIINNKVKISAQPLNP